MTNAMFDAPRVLFITAQFNWEAPDHVLIACSGDYTFDPTHAFVADVVAHGGVVRGTSFPITGKNATSAGYSKSNNTVIPIAASDIDVTFMLLASTIAGPVTAYNLIIYIDEAVGLPFKPNGLDQNVIPDWLYHRGWFRA